MTTQTKNQLIKNIEELKAVLVYDLENLDLKKGEDNAYHKGMLKGNINLLFKYVSELKQMVLK